MATTRGRCTNVDYCSLAAGKQLIDVRIGEDFVCPECAKPLRAPTATEGGGGRLPLFAALGGVVVVLVGGGIYAGYTLSGAPSAPAGGMQMAAPRAASAGTPPAQTPAVQPAMQKPVAADATGASPSEVNLLFRVAGSPTLGTTLMPRLVAAYLGRFGDTDVTVQQGAGGTRVTGQRLSHPETVVLTQEPDAAALEALAAGKTEIAMLARRVTPQEAAKLRTLGDLNTPASEHALALEGEVVIVNPANPVSQLSLAQMRGVLDGTIGSWAALGGTNQAVHLLREPGSTGLADLVPGAPELPSAGRVASDAASSVLADPGGVAVVPMAKAGQAKVLSIAALGSVPAQPTPVAIANGTYPLARRLYLYTPASTTSPFAQRFLTFAVSSEGQAAVAQAGFVPLVVAAPVPAAPLTTKDRYKQLVAGAVRLAADLHFEPKSNVLDLHSAREVDRVWNVMQSDHTPPDHLILIGFADNQGAPEANQALALQRAQAVAEVFKRRGLPPGQVVAFGSELPVADNATEDGRQRNRRVEVFLRP